MKSLKKITLKDAVIVLAVTTWAIGMIVLIYNSITDGLYQKFGDVAQLARAFDLHSKSRGFESPLLHKK